MPRVDLLADGEFRLVVLRCESGFPDELCPEIVRRHHGDHRAHSVAWFERLTLEQADSLIKNNRDLLILDMRAPETYAAAHLRGAVNLPSSSDQLNAYLEPLDRKTKVFGYGDLNPETFNGILRVREMGFLDVFWLSFGYSSWVDAGKPVYDAEEKPVPKETAEALAEEEKKAAGL